MKRLTARILIVALTFCLAFTSLPILTGELSSHAASNPTLKGSLNSDNKPHLTWTKASKAYNGYAVFKNGKAYKRFKTKTFSFIDTAVKDGQTNTYQIKTYKSKKKIKKTKQWYNKQTMKWQTKKPAKKYRGKKRTVKKTTYKYSYKMASNPFAITTKVKISCTSHTYSAATCTSPKTCSKCSATDGNALGHNWGAWYVDKPATTSTEGVEKRTCNSCGEVDTETIPKLSSNVVNIKDIPNYFGESDDGYNIGATVEFTDYLGKKRTFTKKRINKWGNGEISISLTSAADVCEMCKDVDGEWTTGGGTKMYNYHGTTIDMSSFGAFSGVPSSCYTFTAFNMDKNKLKIYPTDATIEPIETYTIDFNPQKTVQNMYVKNSLRIALAPDNGEVFTIKSVGNNESRISIAFTNDATSIGDGLGFCPTTINFQVSYDNKIIGDIKADSMKTSLHQNWSVSNCSRMSPVREKAFEIAWAAVQGQPIEYDTDMKKIENYIRTNYYYGEPIYLNGTNEELFNMKCTGGALVLETYSIILYNKYGYTTPKGGSDITHRNFTPISNPPSDYYNTQGHK